MISPFGAAREPSGKLGRGAADDLFVALRQLAADRHLTLGVEGRERAERGAEPLRRLERDDRPGPVRELAPERIQLACLARQEADERVTAAGEATRDERRLDRGWAWQHGHVDACVERRPHEPRAGVGDDRHPASETSAIRSPAASRGSELGDAPGFVVLVQREQPRRDPVALEQPARMTRVLGEHDIGLAQLCEDAKRHVLEVPDRRRADREWHQMTSNATSPAPIRPACAPRIARSIASCWPAGASASVSTASRADGRSRSNAATPKPPPTTTICGMEDVDERADRDSEVVPHPVERPCRCSTRSCAVASGAEHAPGERVGCPARAVRLDVTAPGAGAAARLAVLDDHHVAELGPAVEERAADDDASPDAGAEREQHEVRDLAARSELELGVGGCVRVVLDPDRQVEPALELGAEIDLVDRDVDGAEHDPGLLVDA